MFHAADRRGSSTLKLSGFTSVAEDDIKRDV